MSILIEGLAATSVSYSPTPRSVLSARFHARLPPHRGTPQLLITTATGVHHAISFPLTFTVSPHAASDVELGLDWTAFLRDSLIGIGYHVDSTFDAWRFLTMSTHPLSTRMYNPNISPDLLCIPHSAHLASSAEKMPQISSRSHLGTVPPTARSIGEGECHPAI
jgi:hypothetical protein